MVVHPQSLSAFRGVTKSRVRLVVPGHRWSFTAHLLLPFCTAAAVVDDDAHSTSDAMWWYMMHRIHKHIKKKTTYNAIDWSFRVNETFIMLLSGTRIAISMIRHC